MKNILIISTGGTFNKRYNPIDGSLEIETSSKYIDIIASKWLSDFKVLSIIGKDSLNINNKDREELLKHITDSRYKKIVIVHGTDTMDITAKFIASRSLEKEIIFTGAMTPFSIDEVEATANLASAIGYIKAINRSGVYISMNGAIGDYRDIEKDRNIGRFR